MCFLFLLRRIFLTSMLLGRTTRDWFDQIQALIPQIAKAHGATLAARIDLFDDYLHPNSRGAELIAENVALI